MTRVPKGKLCLRRQTFRGKPFRTLSISTNAYFSLQTLQSVTQGKYFTHPAAAQTANKISITKAPLTTMSVNVDVTINVTVTIPLEMVAAILSGSSPNHLLIDTDQFAVKTREATIDAVKALPHNIQPKPSTRVANNVSDTISVVVTTATGKRFSIDNIAGNAKASELAYRIQAKEGIPPAQQRLVFGDRMFFSEYDDNNDSVDMSLDKVRMICKMKCYHGSVTDTISRQVWWMER